MNCPSDVFISFFKIDYTIPIRTYLINTYSVHSVEISYEFFFNHFLYNWVNALNIVRRQLRYISKFNGPLNRTADFDLILKVNIISIQESLSNILNQHVHQWIVRGLLHNKLSFLIQYDLISSNSVWILRIHTGCPLLLWLPIEYNVNIFS